MHLFDEGCANCAWITGDSSITDCGRADQPSGISDETSCESCKVSSFGGVSVQCRNAILACQGKQHMYIHIL